MVGSLYTLEENLRTNTMSPSHVLLHSRSTKIYPSVLKPIVEEPRLLLKSTDLPVEPRPGFHVIRTRTASNEDAYFGGPFGTFSGLLWFWNCKSFIYQIKRHLQHWYWAWPQPGFPAPGKELRASPRGLPAAGGPARASKANPRETCLYHKSHRPV